LQSGCRRSAPSAHTSTKRDRSRDSHAAVRCVMPLDHSRPSLPPIDATVLPRYRPRGRCRAAGGYRATQVQLPNQSFCAPMVAGSWPRRRCSGRSRHRRRPAPGRSARPQTRLDGALRAAVDL
jgi:hypothetical protein